MGPFHESHSAGGHVPVILYVLRYFFCCLIQYPDQPHGEPLAVMECLGDVAGIGKHTCQEGGVASLFHLRESQVRVSMHLLIPAFFWDVAQ